MSAPKEILSKRLGEIALNLNELRDKEEIIKAIHTKRIWSDQDFAKYKNGKQAEKLRQAELVLSLSEDKEYQDIHRQIRELEAEQYTINMSFPSVR